MDYKPDIVHRLRDLAEINESDPGMLPIESEILRKAAAEIERLRAKVVRKTNELYAMKRQRDEARREICYDAACARYETGHPVNTEEAIAAERGWDCYKKGGGA